MINIDIAKQVRLLLPPALRKPVHIAFLQSMLRPMIEEWQKYLIWRSDRLYEAHVTSQTISMQAYLNRLFDPILKRIVVSHGESNDFYISLWSEPDGPYIPADDGVYLGLAGEQGAEVNGFIVEIPSGIDQVQVAGVVDSIKAAGVNYEIRINTK